MNDQIVLLVNGVEVKRWVNGTTIEAARESHMRRLAYYENRYGKGRHELAIATTTYEMIETV